MMVSNSGFCSWIARAAVLMLPLISACEHAASQAPLQSIHTLDLARYSGTWYEIAALPNPYQKDCFATQANYAPGTNGTLVVRNSCHKGAVNGPLEQVVGKAWIADGAHPARLKVQFFWPFSGDYWVLALDDAYQWAVVGQPKRKYLWILSRTPHMNRDTYDALVAKLPSWGYNAAQLRVTTH